MRRFIVVFIIMWVICIGFSIGCLGLVLLLLLCVRVCFDLDVVLYDSLILPCGLLYPAANPPSPHFYHTISNPNQQSSTSQYPSPHHSNFHTLYNISTQFFIVVQINCIEDNKYEVGNYLIFLTKRTCLHLRIAVSFRYSFGVSSFSLSPAQLLENIVSVV